MAQVRYDGEYPTRVLAMKKKRLPAYLTRYFEDSDVPIVGDIRSRLEEIYENLPDRLERRRAAAALFDDCTSFINVDLEVYGAFDQEALIEGFGAGAYVVFRDDGTHPELPLNLEITGENRGLISVLTQLVELIRGLPPKARRAWRAASRRRFDIGIQAGRLPCGVLWTIPPDLVLALAKVGAEIGISVYRAEPT